MIASPRVYILSKFGDAESNLVCHNYYLEVYTQVVGSNVWEPDRGKQGGVLGGYKKLQDLVDSLLHPSREDDVCLFDPRVDVIRTIPWSYTRSHSLHTQVSDEELSMFHEKFRASTLEYGKETIPVAQTI